LIAQLAAAHHTLDERAPKDLWLSLKRHAPEQYGDMLLWFLSFFASLPGGSFENCLTVASAAIIWALIGPPDLQNDPNGNRRSTHEIDFSCPAHRVSFALKWFEENGIRLDDPTQIIHNLDQASGSMPFVESINWMTNILENRSKQYRALREQDPEWKDVRAISIITDFLLLQRKSIVEQFISSPGSYIDPGNYYLSINEYPQPPIRFDFTGNELLLKYIGKDNDFLSSGIFEAIECDGGSTMIKSFLIFCPDGIDASALYEYENMNIFTDYHLTGVAPKCDARYMSEYWKKFGMFVVNI
jgi:hypothetical protein